MSDQGRTDADRVMQVIASALAQVERGMEKGDPATVMAWLGVLTQAYEAHAKIVQMAAIVHITNAAAGDHR